MGDSILHNERMILLQVAEGDEKAFHVLYRHFYARLKPVVYKYVDDGIDAEEILQQAFLKVWLNRDKLPEVENVHAWIYRIAYREYLIALRTRMNYEARLEKYATQIDSDPELPNENTHLEDIKKNIQQVVNNLPPQRKAIYQLSRNEGMNTAEIAERLGIAPQTVKNVLFIVLKTIREHLIAAGYGPLTVILFF